MRRHDETAVVLISLGFQPGRRTKHGRVFTHPVGPMVVAAGTPGDVRSGRNTIAAARRALRHMTTNTKEKHGSAH